MSLRVDLEKALENLRTTLQNLEHDIKRFEAVVEEHLNLSSSNKLPRVPEMLGKLINPGDGKP